MPLKNLNTNSPRETKILGFLLGEIFKKSKHRHSSVILGLCGPLGSGKTVFIKGLARGLGIKKKILSPTFVIVKNYKLKTKNWQTLYHFDCYRIKDPKEILDLGFAQIIDDCKNIVVIEWAEKIKKILPKNAVWLKFKYGKKKNERIIQMLEA